MVIKPQATYFDFIWGKKKKEKKSSKESAYKVSEVAFYQLFYKVEKKQKNKIK